MPCSGYLLVIVLLAVIQTVQAKRVVSEELADEVKSLAVEDGDGEHTDEEWCKAQNGEFQHTPGTCICPADRPHWFDGRRIVRAEGTGNPQEILLRSRNPRSSQRCADECLALSLTKEFGNMGRKIRPSDKARQWPVVLLAVYTLQGPIVHSNPVFCPDLSIINKYASKDNVGCYVPGASSCSMSAHTNLFLEGSIVPRALQESGCRELIYDGNGGGGLWEPAFENTGCWGQGQTPWQFWNNNQHRKSLGYQKLYWLTSENTISPFSTDTGSVRHEMTQCFSSTIKHRLDFNPGTYSLLEHNCNKFSTEVMRYLDLPKYSSSDDKGYMPMIAFAATKEESWSRRYLGGLTDALIGEMDAPISRVCKDAMFWAVRANCRRVGWFGGSDGDCPESFKSNDGGLRCYQVRSDGSKPVTVGTVGMNDPVNGHCAIPTGHTCGRRYTDRSYRPSLDESTGPICREGTTCQEVQEEKEFHSYKKVPEKTFFWGSETGRWIKVVDKTWKKTVTEYRCKA